MKVLYVAEGRTSEYQGDMLFHGLRSLLGPDCVDANRMWQMYADSFGEGKHHLSECYGRGFTLYGLLPDDSDIDRTDLHIKIVTRFFDLIICSLIYADRSYFPGILATYPPSQIAFIDGGDSPDILPERGQGLYFKRELADYESTDLLPIQFGIPAEKIIADIPAKTRLMSPYVPWELSWGHIYDHESDYYADYGQSYFARTRKKGGWDCLRHYEILAAGALPYFENLEVCPERTMTYLPKETLLEARRLCDRWEGQGDQWQELMSIARTVLKDHLTTEALAKRVLDYLS
jgi:hypothetical protein